MKQLLFFITGVLLAGVLPVAAQGIPPVYSQFYLNPYVYNPAYAGSDGYLSLYLAHRRQWVGIEGAPVTSSVSLHSPLSEKTATGFLLSHDEAGILRSTSATGTFAYVLPFGREHNVRMGLSAGLNRQSLDLSEATPEQQVYLANRMGAKNIFLAKFGLNYYYKKLNIGVASNGLLRTPTFQGEASPSGAFAPLHDLVVNAIYYFNLVPGKVAAEPFALYHRFENSRRIEGGMLFYFQDVFWTGASYRNNYGISCMFGMEIMKSVKFAYAYEIGNSAISGFQNSTHELQLAFKLGQEKKYSKQIIRKPRFEL